MGIALHGAARFWRGTEGFHGANLIRVLVMDQALYFLVYVLSPLSNPFLNPIVFTNAYVYLQWYILLLREHHRSAAIIVNDLEFPIRADCHWAAYHLLRARQPSADQPEGGGR